MEVLEDLGSFVASVGDAISSFFSFINNAINECTALFNVIPPGITTIITIGLTFSLVLAVKRMVID